MSGVLVCDGVFQVPLSDGWSVTGQPGRAYDISHALLDVGVNITVYPTPAVGGDVEAAVLQFARSTGADVDALKVTRVRVKNNDRGFVRFEADGRAWLAAFVHLARTSVLVSSNSAQGDRAAFDAGELVVASLGPIRKRGLFWRA